MRFLKLVLICSLLAGFLVSAAYSETTTPIIRPITVAGMIAAIDLDAGAVTLNGRDAPTADLAPITFYVGNATRIVKDGKPATLADLAIGDVCAAACIRTSDGRLMAQFVLAKTPTPQVIRVEGKIVSIDLTTSTFKLDVGATDATRRLMWFVIDRSTLIRKDGKVVSLGDLKEGDLAMVAFNPPAPTLTPVERPILALVVDAKTPPPPVAHLVGKLVKISPEGIIAVLPANATAPVLFRVTNETRIIKMKPVDLRALVVGDMVDVAFLRPDITDTAIPRALGIVVQPNRFTGTVVLVDPINRVVTCQPFVTGSLTLGRVIRFQVVPETLIVRAGKIVPLEALRPKDMADVKFLAFPDANIAAGIIATPPVTTTPIVAGD